MFLFFNPRSLAGATKRLFERAVHDDFSIHAPSRERPSTATRSALIPTLFQSTLPRGSDILTLESSLLFGIFNPRSLAGATIDQTRAIAAKSIFNPRSLAGATVQVTSLLTYTIFSIHAPSRERQRQNKILLHSFKSSIYCEAAKFKSAKILF